jgi:hypothetical protein
MPGEKSYVLPGQRADDIPVRRAAEGCFNFDFPLIGEPGDGIEPAAANDSNHA